MKLCLNLLIVSLLVVGSVDAASALAQASLLRPDGGNEEVVTPFEYRHLTTEDKARSVFVPECFYTVLEKDSKAVVGPLCPCIMVAVRHEALDKAVVFHMNNGNSAEGVLEVVQKEFGPAADGNQLSLKMFTRSVKGLPDVFLAALDTSPEEQKALLASVSRILTDEYNLKPEQKKNSIFNSGFAQSYSFYFEADKSVVVDKNLNVKSLSLLAERVFTKRPVQLHDLAGESELVAKGYDSLLDCYMARYFAGVARTLPLPFGCIPVSEAGLEKITR